MIHSMPRKQRGLCDKTPCFRSFAFRVPCSVLGYLKVLVPFQTPRHTNMKSFAILALALFASAKAYAGERKETYYPNFNRDPESGRPCEDFKGHRLSEMPQVCIYDAVCNYIAVYMRDSCFLRDNDPRGTITVEELQALPLGCQQEAICGTEGLFPPGTIREYAPEKPADQDDSEWTFEGDMGEVPQKEPVEPLCVNLSELE